MQGSQNIPESSDFVTSRPRLLSFSPVPDSKQLICPPPLFSSPSSPLWPVRVCLFSESKLLPGPLKKLSSARQRVQI